MSLPNVWHLRTVADNSAKACYICYKPSSRVLITPDNRDFFYVCAGHLDDKGFCSSIVDEEAEAAKKRQAEMNAEIELVKKEYEEKQRRKKEKRKKKDDAVSKETKDENEEEDDAKAKANRDAKIESLQSRADARQSEGGPRVFALNKKFYQMRLDRMRNAELAKRNRERMKDPTVFPTAPRGGLS